MIVRFMTSMELDNEKMLQLREMMQRAKSEQNVLNLMTDDQFTREVTTSLVNQLQGFLSQLNAIKECRTLILPNMLEVEKLL